MMQKAPRANARTGNALVAGFMAIVGDHITADLQPASFCTPERNKVHNPYTKTRRLPAACHSLDPAPSRQYGRGAIGF
ncbi:hypothetical protein I308_101255 [Cryptococcus tetragattii IND107]|uniref:Uncharacterized protein n=1 Tax=Cryptococcus tetragattii IND107 TaxID=1296105 RepID=A0ABR3BZR1_9TREE